MLINIQLLEFIGWQLDCPLHEQVAEAFRQS